MPDVIRTRRLRSCHDISEASSPVPRGLIIRRAGRVDRRPLRHLQGARAFSVRPHHVLLTLNSLIYRVHASASPVRALSVSGRLQFSSSIDSLVVLLAVQRRSTRRGTPRPCPSAMPGACISRVPPTLPPLTGSSATARVRPPTLTTVPPSSHPCSQFTLPTAPHDRRRPYNLRLQRTVTRLLMGASRPQARACS
jgi:hypothetical protein